MNNLELHLIRGWINYATREQAFREITEYIEVVYNRQRRQERLGYLSPTQYERQFYEGKMVA